MNNRTAVCLAMGALLALATGCGKTENAASPAKETEMTTREPKTELTPKAENLAAQTTNGATATAKTAPETAMPPVKDAAPKKEATTNRAPDRPQAVAS